MGEERRAETVDGGRWGRWFTNNPRPPTAPPPFPCSLQPNSSLRSGQSLSSSQWKLAGMHVFVETQRNCVGPHTSSGRLAARGQSQGVWAAGPALRGGPLPLPTCPPSLVSPGSLPHLILVTHSCPDAAHRH